MNTRRQHQKSARPAHVCSPISAVVLAFALASPAGAQDAAGLAKRLAELRAEVEELSSELAAKQQETQDELRSYTRQKAELELELQREQTRLQKVRQLIQERRKQITQEQASGKQLEPLFDKEIAAMRDYVRSSLPFRTGERLAELDKIEEQWKGGLLTPERAVMRLWTFIEDEFRMTRENGLYRQTIRLDGREQLADVIRIGMVALYYRTSDDRVGYALRDGSNWSYQSVTERDDRRRVLQLFDSFKKQIRVGYFALPNALPSVQEP